MRSAKSILTAVIFLMIAISLNSCATVPQPSVVYKEQLTDQGELFFYLQPLPQEMEPLSFTISEISVLTELGESLPLLTSALEIKGRELVGIQKRLVSLPLQPGRYKGIALTLERATLRTEKGEMDLLPPKGALPVDLSFSIVRGRSQALFLFLSPEFLVTDGFSFTPRFALGRPALPPRNFLGFISNSEENNVTVFNKKTMEVVQVIHTGKGPKGMALDEQKGILYIAIAGDSTIELVSLATMQLAGRIKLHFGDEPVELALSPDGQTLISANYGSATVSIIDSRSLSERYRYTIDPDPAYVVAGKYGKRAYVLHTLSNTISVIDLSGRSSFPSIQLDDPPFRGALNRDGEELYIISRYSTELLVVDIRSFLVTDRIFIGGGSSTVTVDPKTNLIYVGKESGEIVVVDPVSKAFIDSFGVAREVGSVVIDGEQNMLLVLSNTGNLLQKLTLISKRRRAHLEVEDRGYALAVMGGF